MAMCCSEAHSRVVTKRLQCTFCRSVERVRDVLRADTEVVRVRLLLMKRSRIKRRMLCWRAVALPNLGRQTVCGGLQCFAMGCEIRHVARERAVEGMRLVSARFGC
ncbi:hypothetical protein CC78DRAFT_349700 [Lojkania enalia]|uniref:Uncharacterized protein n=1 Tax=Lojkania enalia TaxID=147567 RepID=A0A9P4K7J5_9PLEO|nr:hypothetical protein CC78DRAFT_349700 [Didymosphaeria enalia]